MASCTWEHTEEGCPAFSYCRALESYGISLGSEPCLFITQGGAGKRTTRVLTPDAQRHIDSTPKHRSLIEALVQEALTQLARYDTAEERLETLKELTLARRKIFAARMTLWKAMLTASRHQRPFTDTELSYYSRATQEAIEAYQERAATCSGELCLAAACAYDRALKQSYSLQFDRGMIEDIDRLVGNMSNARPTLLVGDKGIAKTQVAKFVMGLYDTEPIVLSIKGDMMSDELIGKLKHDAARNTFVFEEGVLLTAMRRGLPVLLDELNFGDQAIIARLQDILLKRPGEAVSVQESGEESLRVAPGFVVLATANEASQRYRHRAILDPAIRDRFDIITRTYPDLTLDPLTQTSRSLLRIALSSAVDPWGTPSKHIDLAVLEKFVRLAHATQYLYAVPGKNVSIKFEEDHIASSVAEESQPLMTDCITPRTLSKTVYDCSSGNLPGRALNAEYLEIILASLDQAGSTHNYQIAEYVDSLLDFDYDSNFSWLPEEEQELIEPGRTAQRALQGVFAGISERAFMALGEEDPRYL